MAQEKLLKFKVPEVGDVDVYLVRLPDGRVVARTREELEEVKEKPREASEEEAKE